MAITFTLGSATPNRLIYKCYQDGVVTSPPVAANGFATLPNDGGVSPDLLTDIGTVTAPGAQGSALRKLIRVRQDGYGSIAAGAIIQGQARGLLNSQDPGLGELTNLLIMGAVTMIHPMTAAFAWAVDWNVDAQGDPVCEVRSATGTAGYAILDIFFRYSEKQ
jgi:hypothetical protein